MDHPFLYDRNGVKWPSESGKEFNNGMHQTKFVAWTKRDRLCYCQEMEIQLQSHGTPGRPQSDI